MDERMKLMVWFLAVMVVFLFGPVVRAELVGLWKMDEGSGMFAFDQSGNNNNATLHNMEQYRAEWVPGKWGTAICDTGTGFSKPLAIPDSDSLDITGAMTVECWISFDVNTIQYGDIFGKWDPFVWPEARSYTFGVAADGTAAMRLRSDSEGRNIKVFGTTPIPTTGWHHIAFTFDPADTEGQNLHFYLDGAEDSLTDASDTQYYGTIQVTAQKVDIFWGNMEGRLSASLDELCLWNEALPVEELGYYSERTPVPPSTRPLEMGWNLIGSGEKGRVAWSGCQIYKDGLLYSLNDAEDSGWIQSTFYYYDGEKYGLIPGDSNDMVWENGYWIYSTQANLELVIPESQ
jgi:Concanavalin A-like lectin/glucanases superfamily